MDPFLGIYDYFWLLAMMLLCWKQSYAARECNQNHGCTSQNESQFVFNNCISALTFGRNFWRLLNPKRNDLLWPKGSILLTGVMKTIAVTVNRNSGNRTILSQKPCLLNGIYSIWSLITPLVLQELSAELCIFHLSSFSQTCSKIMSRH